MCCAFFCFPVWANQPADPGSTDVQILIDVSGSMKKNDSAYLRIPALKLLVNLLPPESKVGVWLFSADTKPLVPPTRVDENWKKKALLSASKIHSRGLFTDIEDAVTKGMSQWTEADASARRSVILLTDGVVDVSEGPQESTASRKRIIEKLIPKLQQLSIQVHTIALSANADHELLKKMAFDTGGWNKSVQSADQLQRVFLKMFKKAVPRDSVPLQDNKFKIDAGIDEFSTLVFRKSESSPSLLVDPSGTEYSSDTSGEDIKWYTEQGYDLITIKNPMPGDWQLVADVDPDNQVMVVTNLKLILNELPNYVNQNEPLDVAVSITEQGKKITRDGFLELVDMQLVQTDELDRKRDWIMKQDASVKGQFLQPVGETLSPGRQKFRVIADGKTFMREVEYTVDVVENPIEVDVVVDDAESELIIRLRADTEILDPESVQAVASIADADGENTEVAFEEDDDSLVMRLGIPQDDQRLIVNFSVSAQSVLGNAVSPKIRPIILDQKYLDKLSGASDSQDEDEWDDENEDEDEGMVEGTDSEEESLEGEDADWVSTSVIAGGVNLVLIVGGFFAYRFFKKRSENEQMQLLDRLAT